MLETASFHSSVFALIGHVRGPDGRTCFQVHNIFRYSIRSKGGSDHLSSLSPLLLLFLLIACPRYRSRTFEVGLDLYILLLILFNRGSDSPLFIYSTPPTIFIIARPHYCSGNFNKSLATVSQWTHIFFHWYCTFVDLGVRRSQHATRSRFFSGF